MGCGIGTSSPPTTSTSSTTTSSEPVTTLPTTTTTVVPRCSTGVLNATATSSGIAAGSAYETFSLKNAGPSVCVVSGFANLAFFGTSGAGGAGAGSPLTVTISESGTATTTALVPNATATFSMRYSDEPVGGGGCVTVASAEVSLPGNAESLAFPVSLTLCGASVVIGPLGKAGSSSP